MSKCVRNTIIKEIVGNAKNYQINNDRTEIFIPNKVFGKNVAYKIAERLHDKATKIFGEFGDNTSLNTTYSDGTAVNVHPRQKLIDAYELKDGNITQDEFDNKYRPDGFYNGDVALEEQEAKELNNVKYQLATNELNLYKFFSEKFNADLLELNIYRLRLKSIEEKERRGNNITQSERDLMSSSKFSKNYIFNIGNPSSVLQKVGMPNLPITVASNWLMGHIVNNPEHNIKMLDLKGLVEAIHDPIAILNDEHYKGKDGRIELVTTLKSRDGEAVDVIINMNKSFGTLSVNSITTAFENKNLGRFKKAMIEDRVSYVDKDRITNYLQGVLLPSLENSKHIQNGLLIYPKSISNSSTNIEKFLYKINNFEEKLSRNDKLYQQSIISGDKTTLKNSLNPNYSLDEGIKWLKSVLPTSNIEFTNGLVDNIGRASYNQLTDILTFSKEYADKGSVKHEFFHRQWHKSLYNTIEDFILDKMIEDGEITKNC